MNIKCICKLEIGTMGQLMCIFRNIESQILYLEDVDHVIIENTKERINANPFDHIFTQNDSMDNFITINIHETPAYLSNIPDNDLMRIKLIRTKFILGDEIINRFNEIKKNIGINETFLGAHVRLTDMNAWHGKTYGNRYLEDFIRTIDNAMKSNEYRKIFIASDSQESISKLKTIYGNTMVCDDDFIRLESEVGDLVTFIRENLPTNKKWIQDSFIEMLLLSECGGLVHRVSNFANAAKVYSSTIKQTFFI